MPVDSADLNLDYVLDLALGHEAIRLHVKADASFMNRDAGMPPYYAKLDKAVAYG